MCSQSMPFPYLKITDLLTPWSWVLFQNLPVAMLVCFLPKRSHSCLIFNFLCRECHIPSQGRLLAGEGTAPPGRSPTAAFLGAHRGAPRVSAGPRDRRCHPEAVAGFGGGTWELGVPLGVPAFLRRAVCRHRKCLAVPLPRLPERRWWVPSASCVEM